MKIPLARPNEPYPFNPRDEQPKYPAWITMALVVAILAAIAYVAIGRGKPTDVDVASAARTWADRTGIRITGVSCRDGRCTFGTPGQPFDAYCDAEGCTLVGCGSEQ